jgi:hypothetical protein
MSWSSWWSSVGGSLLLLASLPASSNYQLNSYGVGTGGTANSSSANYRINGLSGEQAGSGSSTNFKIGAGENYVKQANVPLVAITNGNNWYDKLKVVIDPQGNPSDAKFVVAISTDGFTTTQYVQSDFTVGSTLNSTNYMTYATWGGATGVMIRGLTPSTIYSVKASAIRGDFTQSAFGPVSTAATVDPQLSFDISVAPSYTSTSPPYVVNIGNLLAGSVVTAPDKIWLTISTNADNGAMIYGDGLNGGLGSGATGHTIASATADLATLTEGFGIQSAGVSQTSGGPLFDLSPYNSSGTNVGQDYTALDEWFGTNAPIVSGVGSIRLMAKSSTLTPSSSDYTETLTAVAAGSF